MSEVEIIEPNQAVKITLSLKEAESLANILTHGVSIGALVVLELQSLQSYLHSIVRSYSSKSFIDFKSPHDSNIKVNVLHLK